MLEEYLAAAMIAERQKEVARYRLGRQALAGGNAPGLFRRALHYAFEPLMTPSRSHSRRETSGHSASVIEKYAESRRVPSVPGE